jgi:predicted aldo/keto reductase-like oxidoreductase
VKWNCFEAIEPDFISFPEQSPGGFMDRRGFLKTASTAVGAAATAQLLTTMLRAEQMAASNQSPGSGRAESGEMIYRTLGRTGERISAIGLGGYHIGGKSLTDQDSIQLIRRAIDRGITFMDNSWDYNGGRSEVLMGRALQDGYRNKVFLMTKINGRTKAAAASQIDESLRRLQVDSVDLMQFHEVIRLEDPDRIFAEGGAMEAMLEAKKAGKLRYIGFTGHKDPLVHLRMLEIARKHQFRFDAVQMPLNVMDAHFRSFTHDVVPGLVSEGIGVLGMKCFGDSFILKSNTVKPIECLHYCLNLPVSVQITGLDRQEILDQALEAARTYHAFSEAELASLLDRTRPSAQDGKYELYKTTSHFDGSAHDPRSLG